MTLTDLRHELEQAREYAREGAADRAIATIERALAQLDRGRLLTTTEAAAMLGVRSVNTLKALLRAERVPTVRRGNRTLVALGEVERLQQSPRLHTVRTLDRLHDETADLGGDRPLTRDELDDLEAGRPGVLPWRR